MAQANDQQMQQYANERIRVRAESFRETWTQHDPELSERDLLPPERRRGLKQ